MNYYAVQVKTRGENTFLKLAKYMLDVNCEEISSNIHFIWPRRKLSIRKQGKVREQLSAIFPGYIFLETESIPTEVYWTLRKISGFFRFLRSNQQIEPLEGIDRELLLHFLSYGEVVEKSTVYFDKNQKIRVIKGPMKGLEGKVVKVDRRKKRAKIKLQMYDTSFPIDFGFELIENAEEKE